MSVAATVLIPTYNHGPTLYYSVRSALAQTVQDIEVVVIGDGVPDVTRKIVGDLTAEDSRVRFLDHPKDRSQGEVYRHAALAEARGEIVCYLSDDDLWLPNHIKTMRELLRDADFAHALPVAIAPDGSVRTSSVILEFPFFRDWHLAGVSRISLSCGAHSLEMYRKLPAGWRATPKGVYSDLYMWQQFLALPNCRAVSGTRPTVATFPSIWRRDWSIAERVAELEHWAQGLAQPSLREAFVLEVLDAVVRERSEMEMHAEALSAERQRLEGELRRADAEILRLEGERLRLELELQQVSGERDSLRAELQAIHQLPSWRLRRWALSFPLADRANGWVGRLLAGRAGRRGTGL